MNFEIHCRLLEADMWVSELLVGSPLQGFTEHRKDGGRQLSGRWCRCRAGGGAEPTLKSNLAQPIAGGCGSHWGRHAGLPPPLIQVTFLTVRANDTQPGELTLT